MAGDELARAVEVFVHAFAQGKSRTHPYLVSRHQELWVMRDAPRKSGGSRKVESVGLTLSPEDVAAALAEAGVGWHFHCDVVGPHVDLASRKELFKQAGYRALGTEWVFVHDLREVPAFDSRPGVRHVTSKEEFDRLPGQGKYRRPWFGYGRQYVVHHPNRPVGWVRSVPFEECAWVSDLYVHEPFRRQGYGRALMSRLLQDDRELGFGQSVLVASRSGAMLYPLLGYRLVGALQVFCPAVRPA